MELKFKRLEDNAILPIRGTKGAAGIDLTCTKIETALNEANQLMLVYLYHALVFGKSHYGLLITSVLLTAIIEARLQHL